MSMVQELQSSWERLWEAKVEANFPENEETFDNLFYSCMNTQEESQHIWYFEGGCNNRTKGNRSSFVSLHEEVKLKVNLGDGKHQNVRGEDIIAIQTKGSN